MPQLKVSVKVIYSFVGLLIKSKLETVYTYVHNRYIFLHVSHVYEDIFDS